MRKDPDLKKINVLFTECVHLLDTEPFLLLNNNPVIFYSTHLCKGNGNRTNLSL